jgi:hypothetical protein
MMSIQDAAALVGESVSTVRRWVAAGRCIGLASPGDAMRLPSWQFQGEVLLWIQSIGQALEATNGWHILSFLETPHGGLGGLTPRQGLEQGNVELVLALALD